MFGSWTKWGAVLLAALFFNACASSDDGDSDNGDALVEGEYLAVQVTQNSHITGSVTYDGAGNGTYSYSNAQKTGDFSYSINDINRVSAENDQGDTQKGIVSQDGNLVVYASSDFIKVHIKNATQTDNASLDGDFIAAQLMVGKVATGIVSYDGAGNGTYVYDEGSGADSGPFTYTVDSAGKISFGSTLGGYIGSDEKTLVYFDDGYLEFGFKKDTDATDALLKGDYITVFFGFDQYGIGTSTFDGAGRGALSLDTGMEVDAEFSYSVRSNGRVDATNDSQNDPAIGIGSDTDSRHAILLTDSSDAIQIHTKQ